MNESQPRQTSAPVHELHQKHFEPIAKPTWYDRVDAFIDADPKRQVALRKLAKGALAFTIAAGTLVGAGVAYDNLALQKVDSTTVTFNLENSEHKFKDGREVVLDATLDTAALNDVSLADISGVTNATEALDLNKANLPNGTEMTLELLKKPISGGYKVQVHEPTAPVQAPIEK